MTAKKLRLLLKKNLIVEYRSFVQTFFEITIILIIFCISFQLKPYETVKENHLHRDLSLNDLSQFRELMSIKDSVIPYKLFFTPNNSYTKNIFKLVAEKLNLKESVGFVSETSMLEQFNASTILACVILHDHDITLRFPNYFRTRHNKNFYKLHDFWLTRCSGVMSDEDNINFYTREGFLQLLYTIVKTQIEVENIKLYNNYKIPTQISSMFPSKEPKLSCANNLNRNSTTPQRFLMWSLYYFIYFLPFINLIWKFSRECEENIFAHHWIYGYSYSAQRLAHLIVTLFHFILLDTVVLVLIFLLCPPPTVWKYPVLFAFLIINNILLILYALTLSLFIKNAKTAVWFAVTLWIVSYAVLSEILNILNFDMLEYKIFIISLIFFNNLLPNGLMDHFEREESRPLKEIVVFLGMQIFIVLFYGCLLKYVESNWPGRYMKKLESAENTSKQTCEKCYMEFKPKLNENHFEYGPLNLVVLQLKNVYSYCQHFRNKQPQLRNISMRFFENEISVILGPHNSGKTTFVSILAGWQRHKGSIAYQEHDVYNDWSYYRNHVDVSMTNNCLFDRLTVLETLKYFILLKQRTTTHLKLEEEKWLQIMKIIVDCQKMVEAMSFGEKRILALCCAMVCNTSIILLDEPTQHMMVEDQKRYWNILLQEKRNRVIIVTTVNVDEAHEIGDRIGILNEGCLSAWGTSYFLRNIFAQQFYLICFLKSRKPIEPITHLIGKYIPNLQIYNHFLDRVIYIMPADKKAIFQKLLIQLEKDSSSLGITNIYMSGSSLSEVFMSTTLKQDGKNKMPDIKRTLKFLHLKEDKLKENLILALLYKKLLLQAKNFLPICTIFIAFFVILALRQLSPAGLKTNGITFSGRSVIKDTGHTLMEILNVEDIEKGLFYYENVTFAEDSYENRSWNNYNSLAAIEMKSRSMSVWYNEKIFHSAPLSLNLAFNYLTNGSIYTNKPIVLRNKYNIHIILGTINPLTMSVAFVNLQDEWFSGMLTLQRLAHLNDKIKWSVTFLWDFAISVLISILYIFILITCVLNNSSWMIVNAALILIFLYNMASLIFIYLMSLFIKEDNKLRAVMKIFMIQLISGIFPYVLHTNILQSYLDYLFYIFMLLPGYSVLHGTNKIFDNNEKLDFSSYFQWYNPGILDSIFFMSLTSVTYFIIFVAVLVYRRAYFQSIPKNVKNLASVCYPYDDERVIKEKVRISNMNIDSCRSQAVLVDQLESKLPKKGNRVDTISFALNKHFCLGIYGPSHAGKSHLLKQLVGEKGYWFGQVYIAGFNSKKQMAGALKQIGYCPQKRGFNSLLTPTELLTFFLMLYGVKESNYLDRIRDLSGSLQLRKFMSSKIGDLPENIKRRINVAVALIAHKKVLIFDEPTKGLPAFDRLLIWNIIRFCRSLDKIIIFATSESFELKELADIVVTVNDGKMLSHDNPHNMEYRYNVGFFLEIKLYADGLTLEEVEENINADVENLNRFLMFFHEESELLYRCGSVVKYHIPVENVIYSYIFGSLEKNRNRLNIADYTLGPFSLCRVLRSLQNSHKEKRRYVRSRTSILKDAKSLPRRY